MLANLDIPGSIISGTISESSHAFMENVSANLEKLNIKTMLSIESGELSSNNLDARLVHLEQTNVQNMLDAFQNENPAAYSQLTQDLDNMFNGDTYAARAMAAIYPSDGAYQEVLDQVRSNHSGTIDFLDQSVREEIGLTLIQRLHRSQEEWLKNNE